MVDVNYEFEAFGRAALQSGVKNFASQLLIFASLLLIAPNSFALPNSANVKDSSSGKIFTTNVIWDHYFVPTEGKSLRRYMGRIDISSDLVGYHLLKSIGGTCLLEANILYAYLNSNKAKCIVETLEKSKKIIFSIKMEPAEFENRIDPACEDPAVAFDVPTYEFKTGYVALSCQKIKNGFLFNIDHSDDFSIQGSNVHEDYGKYENFKTYKIIGVGKLSNQEDFDINTFALVEKGQTYKEDAPKIHIRKKSFLFTKQSPFEIEVGAGLVSSSFSGTPGSTSNFSGRGIVGLLYDYRYNWIFELDAAADITNFDDGSNIEKAAYIFLVANTLLGYRFRRGVNGVFELGAGLTFSKFSYQLGENRSLYSRRGLHFKGTYKSKFKEQTKWWIDAMYSHYLVATTNSIMGARYGHRLYESKFSAWGEYDLITLENAESTTGSEKGQTMIAGISLDF